MAFWSWASNVVPGDTNDHRDVFVRDLKSGTTRLVSVATDGRQANNGSSGTAISADGRYVAFWSWASNLVPCDTNHRRDVFVRDLKPSRSIQHCWARRGPDGRKPAAPSRRATITAPREHVENLRLGPALAAAEVGLRSESPPYWR